MKKKTIQIYNVKMYWYDEPSQPYFYRVTVGLCPEREWGDNLENWTDSQTAFDETIFYCFEDLEELKEYTKKNGYGEWYIEKYDLDETINLEDI